MRKIRATTWDYFSKVYTRNMLNLTDLAKIGSVDVVAPLQNFMNIASSIL